MAIYFLRCKCLYRHKGKSMVGRSAYCNGLNLYDQKKKRSYSYANRNDVVASFLYLPKKVPGQYYKRKVLWNEVEKKETIKKGSIGYEIIVAIPYELKVTDACDLIKTFSKTLAEFYECAVDSAIHVPPENSPIHDKRNIHAHILMSKRQFDCDGYTQTLIKLNHRQFKSQIGLIRKCWELLVNDYLAKNGCKARIDHRTLQQQGVNRIPQIHVGKKAKYLHFANKVPASKKKAQNGGSIMHSSTKDVRAMSLTKKSYRLIRRRCRSPKFLFPKR